MKHIVFITPRDARHGFSLTGVTQFIVTPDEAEDGIRKAMADQDCGVVIIDERLLPGIGEERFREMERKWFGLLIVLPAPEKIGEEGEEYAERLIRRVIGYHVRLSL